VKDHLDTCYARVRVIFHSCNAVNISNQHGLTMVVTVCFDNEIPLSWWSLRFFLIFCILHCARCIITKRGCKINIRSDEYQWFSKLFSHSSLTNLNTTNWSTTNITNNNCKNSALPTVKKQQTNMNQTDSFITSVTAVKAACTCKLLQLLPDRRMLWLIKELVGNRSFTLSPYHC